MQSLQTNTSVTQQMLLEPLLVFILFCLVLLFAWQCNLARVHPSPRVLQCLGTPLTSAVTRVRSGRRGVMAAVASGPAPGLPGALRSSAEGSRQLARSALRQLDTGGQLGPADHRPPSSRQGTGGGVRCVLVND